MFRKLQSLLKKEAVVEKPVGGEVVDAFPQESEAFLVDPYPFYRSLLELPSLHRAEDGMVIVARYQDNVDALSTPQFGNAPSRFSTLHSSKSVQFECADLARNIMPFLDGPEHKEQRKVIGRLFQKQVLALEESLPEIAREVCQSLGEEFDAMSDLGTPFALKAVNRLLGFPEEERTAEWSGLFFYLFTQIPTAELREEVNAAIREFREWIGGLFDASDCSGLVATFKEAVVSEQLSKEVAVDTLILLFADGLENVDTGIANALHSFAKHPEQWQRLREEPSLVKSAVDECLRYDSPAQYVARTVLEDCEWKGVTLKKDYNILLLLGAANHDAAMFPEPGVFDIGRKPNAHLSFGRGKHSCLGGKLVEKEMCALLAELVKVCPSPRLISEITWQSRKGHRWIESARFSRG